MVYHLKYSPVAEDDLDRVWDEVWEASQNYDVADKYVEDLRNALKQKKKYPKTGSLLLYLIVMSSDALKKRKRTGTRSSDIICSFVPLLLPGFFHTVQLSG